MLHSRALAPLPLTPPRARSRFAPWQADTQPTVRPPGGCPAYQPRRRARHALFSVCPVRGPRLIEDNFGVIVRLPHVPVHVHQGDDIVAPLGTPVVAPFAGYASVDDSLLGGMGVKVSGPRGFVFQAHLDS